MFAYYITCMGLGTIVIVATGYLLDHTTRKERKKK